MTIEEIKAKEPKGIIFTGGPNSVFLKDSPSYTEKLFEADSILIAVSQVPQDKLVNRDKELKLNERGNLATNEKGETTMPGVFASGDVVTGAKTVVHAVRYSKEIAEDMDRYMKSLPANG